jgi:hypothetical protein
MIKSIRMRWVGHVACMGERRVVHRVLVGRPGERDNLEYLGINGRVILKWIFTKWDSDARTGLL